MEISEDERCLLEKLLMEEQKSNIDILKIQKFFNKILCLLDEIFFDLYDSE